MDPVSAVGVAAAAVQFAEITFKITKRIAVFTVLRDVPDDAKGPKALVERLRNQLGLLNSTVQRIEEGLKNNGEGFKDSELLELSDYVSNLNRHAGKLDELLTSYLPKDDDSTQARLLAAMKSIASDFQIESLMASINQLLPLLTTFLLTSMAFKNGFRFTAPGATGMNAEFGQAQPVSSAIYRVSRHEVRHFVDRPEVLAEIGRSLDEQPTQSPRVVILQGMGGQGKTQLALRYCANSRLQKRFGHILWVDASSKTSTLRGLEELSGELNDSNQALLDSDARLAFVRRKLTAASVSWLLVLDNYDDPGAFDLREYIPKNPLGSVLITSRSTDAERIGSMIRVSGMTEDEATEVLFKQLGIPKDAKNQAAAADIVRRLGYLPLAIDQAGAYMKAEAVPLVDFLAHYEQSAIDVLNSVPNLWEYTDPASSKNGGEMTGVVAKTVFTTWNLSFSLLKPDTCTGRLKANVLSLLAFFDEHEISEEFFQAYCSANHPCQKPEWMSLFTDVKGQWSSRKFDSVMREFSRLSLITALNTERKDTEYAVISLHPLVRDWINLRQEDSMHKANFATFTQLLGAVLLPALWESPVDFEYEFRLSSTSDRQLHAHTISWIRMFGRYKSDSHPAILIPECKGKLVATSSEQLIAMYLWEIDLFEISLELSQWLWECYDISDGQLLQPKLVAGIYEIKNLHQMCLYEEAKCKSLEKLQYWETVSNGDASYADMQYQSLILLIKSLQQTINSQDKREVLELCRSELEKLHNDEQNMLKRHELLTHIMHAAHFLDQNDVRDATLETILNETVRCDGNDSWKKTWSVTIMYTATMYTIDFLNDSDIVNQLSLMALEWAADKSKYKYLAMRLLRAAALSKMAKSAEAEAMVRDCIANYANIPSAYADMYESLGNILKSQERYEEAYEAYNSALLQLEGSVQQIRKLNLLGECAGVAEKFNLELADAHMTSRLSLVKKTGFWADIAQNIMEAYRIKKKIGTEIATQDGLELLAEGLELYGVEFVYGQSSVPRTCLRPIKATINLSDPESLKDPAECIILQEVLTEKHGFWYGFDLLIRIAVNLLKTMNIAPAEQAFRLAKTTFEKAKDLHSGSITHFVWYIFYYVKLYFKVDRDGQRLREILDWARLQICAKLENGMEGMEDWWETETKILEDFINSPKDNVSEKASESGDEITAITEIRPTSPLPRAMQSLSGRFSQAISFKLPRLSRSRPSISLRRGLLPVHSAAVSPASPAIPELRDHSTLKASYP
ncbi:hypothetical protein F5Y05DRAFT_62764 [Hypoxylon sp. FL0543]|nr:hypothetical protein F5Y05DRAFT_62764 [Hypoxylon sp. FL0543]